MNDVGESQAEIRIKKTELSSRASLADENGCGVMKVSSHLKQQTAIAFPNILPTERKAARCEVVDDRAPSAFVKSTVDPLFSACFWLCLEP